MNIPRSLLLKSELAKKLDCHPKTLYRFMKSHEKAIKMVSPSYNPLSRLLYPIVIDYIIKEMGFSHDEIYNKTVSTKTSNLSL